MGGELTSNKPDWKAGLYFGTELSRDHPDATKPMHGPNLWPSKYPAMKELVRTECSSGLRVDFGVHGAVERSGTYSDGRHCTQPGLAPQILL